MSKFKIGDKVFKPKGYKFPGTVVSIFQTTSGETRIVAEMLDNGMLHIFNENQLEFVSEKELIPNISECERVARSMINNSLTTKVDCLDDAKGIVNKTIDNLLSDTTLPQFLIDYWTGIKIAVNEIDVNRKIS